VSVCSPTLAIYSAVSVGLLWHTGGPERRLGKSGLARLLAVIALALVSGLFAESPLDAHLLLMQALAPAASADATTGEVSDAVWIPGFSGWSVLALLSRVRLPDPVAIGGVLLVLAVAYSGRLAGSLGEADAPALIMSGLFLNTRSLILLVAFACALALSGAFLGNRREVPFIPYIFSAATLMRGSL
jgi:hypothetical protein